MRNTKKLDKKTRLRLRELAKVENVYYDLGSNSAYKGFSTFSGMSKRSSAILKANSIENRKIRFVDSGRSQKIYS
jgi:hypothetical protein